MGKDARVWKAGSAPGDGLPSRSCAEAMVRLRPLGFGETASLRYRAAKAGGR
jgi:hypothetical protein